MRVIPGRSEHRTLGDFVQVRGSRTQLRRHTVCEVHRIRWSAIRPPIQECVEKAGHDTVQTIERRPSPVQVLCVMGGSALGLAVNLVPFLLF